MVTKRLHGEKGLASDFPSHIFTNDDPLSTAMVSSPQFFDITLEVFPEMVMYPGDSPPNLIRTADLHDGQALTVTTLDMNCHTGTHVDAPSHFIPTGRALDALPLESFYGPAVVLDLRKKPHIQVPDLSALPIPSRHHLLLKTDNSNLWTNPTFTPAASILSPAAAEYLTTRAPLSIGFDHYSLDPDQPEGKYPAHLILARANLPVFVALNLSAIQPGAYTFTGFPLRLRGVEASPVRAVLLKERP